MSRLTASDRRREQGFSLVEVLAAVAIMAVALVTLYRGAGGAQRAAQYMEAHLGARLVAESLIEDARQSPITGPDTRKGESGLYQWQLVIAPVDMPGIGKMQGGRFYHLQAQIAWGRGGSFTLDALKLGR